MKFNYKLMSLSLAAFGLMACSDDIGKGGGMDIDPDGTNVRYLRATVSLPSIGSSRSQTDTPADDDDKNNTNSNGDGQTTDDGKAQNEDFEYGYDYENDVRSMVLVITNDNDQYITHVTITGITQASTTNQEHVFWTESKIPYSLLDEVYSRDNFFNLNKAQDAYVVRLYAFCNYTQHLKEQFDELLTSYDNIGSTKWINFMGQVEEKASMAGETPVSQASIWSKRSFLMANAEVYESEFPKTLDEWDQYADSNNPLYLAPEEDPIPVERVAARIDFKDGSENGDQTYPIRISKGLLENLEAQAVDIEPLEDNDDNVDYLELYNVKLERMVLVNMSKNFYYLRRVSNDGLGLNGVQDNAFSWPLAGGTNTNQWWPAGTETPDNYVVDSKWYEKSNTGINPGNASDYFNFPMYDSSGTMEKSSYNNIGGSMGWYISNIKKAGDKTSVLDPDQPSDNWGGKQYKVWRYVTENTIPGVENQITVQSTGIIFKASIRLGKDHAETRKDGTPFITEAVQQALEDVYDPDKNKTQNPWDYPALYSFSSVLFGGVPDIIAEGMNDNEGGALFYAVNNILSNWYCVRKINKGADGTVTYEAAEGYKSDKGQMMFLYSETAPVAPEGHDVVQLNIVIANQIVNGVAPTDNSFNYADGWTYTDGTKPDSNENAKYVVDFRNNELTEDHELYHFDNSRFMQLCPDRNITVFVPTNDDGEGLGYYCYYFYWIRHNDNLKDGKMGPMEFATVRNNVYKISVTNVKSIGHPRNSDRDPDPVNPDDPDEEAANSIKVDIKVLPWVVRVNDIKF